MQRIHIIILVLTLAVTSGCNLCFCSKRASEKQCPTDVRKSHFWCFGEDAIFHNPCGPKEEFYGHEPTCWREWPSSGSEWRDANCGPPVTAPMPYEEELLYAPTGPVFSAPPQSIPQRPIEGDEPARTSPQERPIPSPMGNMEKGQVPPPSPRTNWPEATVITADNGIEFKPALDFQR